jgi:hypothetical protein
VDNKDYRLPDEKIANLLESAKDREYKDGGMTVCCIDIYPVLDAQIADLLKEVPVEKLKEEIEYIICHECLPVSNCGSDDCSKLRVWSNKVIELFQRFTLPLLEQAKAQEWQLGQEELTTLEVLHESEIAQKDKEINELHAEKKNDEQLCIECQEGEKTKVSKQISQAVEKARKEERERALKIVDDFIGDGRYKVTSNSEKDRNGRSAGSADLEEVHQNLRQALQKKENRG